MESLYKVGDKVKVIARTAKSCDYRFCFVDEMCLFAGKIVTIKTVIPSCHPPEIIEDDGYCYKIVEDNGFYSWASSMFVMSQSSDTSTKIKIKVKTNQIKFNFKN